MALLKGIILKIGASRKCLKNERGES